MVAESIDAISVQPLAVDELYRASDPSNLAFSTTAELQPIDGLVGQTRALEAIQFGTKVEKAGFNLFIIGPNGARMQDAVKAMLAAEARQKPVPSDWVYVNNFTDPERPIALELPGGRARKFQQAMHKLIDDLKGALPAIFQRSLSAASVIVSTLFVAVFSNGFRHRMKLLLSLNLLHDAITAYCDVLVV